LFKYNYVKGTTYCAVFVGGCAKIFFASGRKVCSSYASGVASLIAKLRKQL